MIFLDFDGTIVNLWPRYYAVFCAASQSADIPYDLYVSAKRNKLRDEAVARALGVDLPPDYFEKKRQLLETQAMLRKDTPWLPTELLQKLFAQEPCRILTMRRREDLFFQQLSWLHLEDLQQYSIVLDPDSGIKKADYLKANYSEGNHTIIGDSAAELEAGRLANVQAILVTSGLLDPTVHPLPPGTQIVRDLEMWVRSLVSGECTMM